MGQDGKSDAQVFSTAPGDWTTVHYGEERGGKTLALRFKANSKGVTPVWRDLKKRLGVKTDREAYDAIEARLRQSGLVVGDNYSNVQSLSDIIHAASNGRVSFNYGHYEPGYWTDASRIFETWADYNASLVTNVRELRLIREFSPMKLL